MAGYLLDTNHLSPMVTLTHPLRKQILERVHQGDKFSIPIPALSEMLYGIQTIARAKQNIAEWKTISILFDYYPIDRTDAEKAATLRVNLRRQGKQLAIIDSLIAAVALRNRLILLTTDKDFNAISDLVKENWIPSN